MEISPANITCYHPLFLKTTEGSYINSNNITKISQIDTHWYVHSNEYGIDTKYNIDDSEAQKVLNFYA